MTMTPMTPTLKLHTHQDNNGIHINSIIMKHNGNMYHIHASTKDTIYIYQETLALYVLTISKTKGTMGLAAYMSPEPFSLNSYYMNTIAEIETVFGPEWDQLQPLDIAMKLINYLM